MKYKLYSFTIDLTSKLVNHYIKTKKWDKIPPIVDFRKKWLARQIKKQIVGKSN